MRGDVTHKTATGAGNGLRERNSETRLIKSAVEALAEDIGNSVTGYERFEVASSVLTQAEDSLYFFAFLGKRADA